VKILIVDDNRLNLAMTSSYCRKWGYVVVTAMDGAQAVECYLTERPDLILMDVMMPVMDGLEATARIRTLSEPRWVPIILLTALGSDEDLVRGVTSGADDYLTKPVNFTVLREKIRVMERIAALQGQLTESLGRLQEYRDRAEEERSLAVHVMDSMMGFRQVDDERVIHCIVPALNFSGDVVAWARTPTGDLHVILADATGHGLAAAFNVMPVTEVFYGMTAKGFPIYRIANEINRKIRRLMPRDRFVAAVLASIELTSHTVSVWNGGCPTALFVDEDGEVLRTFASLHPPLGILPESAFSAAVEVYQWPVPGQLLVCSDGLLEAEDAEGIPFSLAGLTSALPETPPRDRPDRIMAALRHHLAGAPQLDDISLVAVECPDRSTTVTETPLPLQPSITRGQWHLRLCLGADEVRRIDVLPFLLDWCRQVGLDEQRLSKLFVVVTELYNNALDHGLLGLDSHLKAEPDGFERYLRLRTERLEALGAGCITVELSVVKEEPSLLRVQVMDSGPGFDHAAYGRALSNGYTFSRRGIALVRNLCRKVEFLGCGNEVVAYYPLS
jgi:CheY-like chemotaxis protein/anti-sigma regulatory factor (Ser/Thr protein kinase)